MIKKLAPVMAAALMLYPAGRLQATPYASGITNDAGTIRFYLNENANAVGDGVKIIFNGGASTNNLGALARGRHSFALGANTSFAIQVTKSSGAGWKSADGTGTNAVKLEVTTTTNLNLHIENPRGLKINRNVNSPYFGRIYSSQNRTNSTGSGRVMQPGIYLVNPDESSAHPVGEENVAQTANLVAVAGGAFSTAFPYEFHHWCR